jgi:hypothetical protein
MSLGDPETGATKIPGIVNPTLVTPDDEDATGVEATTC